MEVAELKILRMNERTTTELETILHDTRQASLKSQEKFRREDLNSTSTKEEMKVCQKESV